MARPGGTVRSFMIRSEMLSPEAACLIEAARQTCSDIDAPDAAPLPEPDWNRLIELAMAHGMTPLLANQINRTHSAKIPQDAHQRLRECVRGISHRNLFLAAELLRVVTLLAEAGIPAVPYKGVALGEAAYGSLALRPSSDIDLLVAEADVRRARDLLLAGGYEPEISLTGEAETRYFANNCELNLARREDEGRARVELHWLIVPPEFSFGLDAETMIGRARPAPLQGRKILTLETEDLLLALCAHGCKHHWSRLIWICDLARVINRRRDAICWDTLCNRAAFWGSSRMLGVGLTLARELAGAAIPDVVIARLDQDPAIPELVRAVRGRLFLPKNSGWPTVLRKQLHLFRIREQWRDRLPMCRFFLKWLFAPDYANDSPVATGRIGRLAAGMARPFRLLRDYAFNAPTIRR